MLRINPKSFETQIHPVLAALHTEPIAGPGRLAPPRTLPFVTISREAGAGGQKLAEKLVDKLRKRDGVTDPPWSTWDRELVEKVAQDHHISTRLIESLEDADQNWLKDLLGGFVSDREEELVTYHKVAGSIRALALAGHAIIVGRGGVFVTRHMPLGVHVRLVAPVDRRIARIMEVMNLDHPAAAKWVHDQDRHREAFFRKHWYGVSLGPESFTITLNTGMDSDEERIVNCVAALVPL